MFNFLKKKSRWTTSKVQIPNPSGFTSWPPFLCPSEKDTTVISCGSLQVPAQFKAPMGPDCIPQGLLPDSAIVPVMGCAASDTETSWHLDITKENIKVRGQCNK